METEFNPDGSLKLSQHIEEARKQFKEKLKKAEKNPDKVLLRYEEVEQGHEDNWIITLPDSVPKEILFKLKNWADRQHTIEYGRAWIEQEDKNTFILNVRGYKNRCTWAHAFLNGLRTALLKDFATKIEQKGTCKHDFFVKNYL